MHFSAILFFHQVICLTTDCLLFCGYDNNNNNNNNNTLFVQYHEQEIPEVIPIEGIPFVNKSKWNQINLTQHKSNQILVFEERGKPEYPEKNLSEQSREPTNSAHIWRRVRESNPGHIGGRRALWHCANPAPLIIFIWETLFCYRPLSPLLCLGEARCAKTKLVFSWDSTWLPSDKGLYFNYFLGVEWNTWSPSSLVGDCGQEHQPMVHQGTGDQLS